MVWSIIGWTLLALLGLFLLLILVPITVHVRVQDGVLNVRLRVLFLKFTVYPGGLFAGGKKRLERRAAKKRKQKTPEEEKEPGPETEKKRMTPSDVMLLIHRVAAAMSAAMRWVMRGFWVRGVELVWPIEADDAAALALKYGRMQALVGTTRAVLSNVVHLSCKRLVLIPDFAQSHRDEFFFSCKVVVSPVIMFVAGVAGFSKFLTYKRTTYRKAAPRSKSKAGKMNAQKERA